MVKVSSSDLIAILRRFNHANEDNVPRHVEHVTISNPSPENTLVAFRFNKQHYYVLFDERSEDNPDYVLEQIKTHRQDVHGILLENPHNPDKTYGLPFKGNEVYLFLVTSSKKRLDQTLAERYPDISRSTWQKYIKAGNVAVNGVAQESPKYETGEADTIAVSLPAAADHSEHELPIIYIDDHVIVINKPVGILTHAKGALNDEFTVAEFFRRYTTVGLDTTRPGIVHRLDRDTSGVMIGARTPEAAALLQKQFADRKAKKTYLAIVEGHPKNSEARIELPIGRNPASPSTFRVDAKGKPATTGYRVLNATDTNSLIELKPQTGRTHQLRVHMQYLGTPIKGDRIYGKPADRLYLHAYTLELTLPGGMRRTFTAEVPSEFSHHYPRMSFE